MEVQLEEHSLLLVEVFFLDQALEWQVGGNFVLYNKSPGPSDCNIDFQLLHRKVTPRQASR
jgi:hypothetical protein